MLLFIIVLFTLTNIVKQMIENLYARVQVGWKILLALKKNVHVFVQVSMSKIKQWLQNRIWITGWDSLLKYKTLQKCTYTEKSI